MPLLVQCMYVYWTIAPVKNKIYVRTVSACIEISAVSNITVHVSYMGTTSSKASKVMKEDIPTH